MITFTDNPITRIEDLPFEEYKNSTWTPGINQSLLKEFDYDLGGCPALYHYRVTHPEDRKPATPEMEFGTAWHHFIHSRDSFDQFFTVRSAEIEAHFTDLANVTKKGAQKRSEKFSANFAEYKAWAAAQEDDGKRVITQKDSDRLHAMREALMNYGPVKKEKLFDDAAVEVTLFAPFELRDGRKLQIKARVDLLPKGDVVIDLKSCQSAHPRKFARVVNDLGYDLQSSVYVDLCRLNGLDKKRFGFLSQEKTPPYLPCIHWMPEDWIKYGRVRYRKILGDIAECIRLNHWPGYGSGMLEWPSYLDAEISSVA